MTFKKRIYLKKNYYPFDSLTGLEPFWNSFKYHARTNPPPHFENTRYKHRDFSRVSVENHFSY